MPKRVIETNPHLRTESKREESIVRSAIASAKIEGITISKAKARQMYREAYSRVKKSS
jgi:hypothetical protein